MRKNILLWHLKKGLQNYRLFSDKSIDYRKKSEPAFKAGTKVEKKSRK